METFQTILTFIQAILIIAIPAYFVWKQKSKESEAAVNIARIENEDDLTIAQGKALMEFTTGYKLLAEEAKQSIIEAKKTREEMRQLRDYVKTLEERVRELEEQDRRKNEKITGLEADNVKKQHEIKNLRQRLSMVNKALNDTGRLGSKPSIDIPKEDDK